MQALIIILYPVTGRRCRIIDFWEWLQLKQKNSLSVLFDIFNCLFMLLVCFTMAYPVWHVLMASLSDNSQLIGYTGLLFKPLSFSTKAYTLMMKNPMILRGYLNTVLIVVVGVSLNMIFTTVAAYFFSRTDDIYWQKPLMVLIMLTMFFSGGLIPFYLVVSNMLHLNNSFWALILPTLINTYNLIIMKTSFSSLPKSLEESAKLDGAGHITILLKVVVPLSMPVIAVMILYYAVGQWNSWFNANIFIKDRSKYPLQLVLREILIQNDTSAMTQGAGDASDQQSIGESVKYAVVVAASLPILVVYPFLQKYFVKGVMIGAVKG